MPSCIINDIIHLVPPTVKAPSQLLGAPLGSDVQLECQVEASPSPVSYWLKGESNSDTFFDEITRRKSS